MLMEASKDPTHLLSLHFFNLGFRAWREFKACLQERDDVASCLLENYKRSNNIKYVA